MNKDEIIRSVEADFIKNDIPDFSPGDVVRVHEQIGPLDEEKSEQGTPLGRKQIFEGVVLKRSGGGTSEMFTVRKDSFGVGIEKVFPLHSPRIEKIELVQKGSVHQARPYYLRSKTKRKPKRRAPTEEEMDKLADRSFQTPEQGSEDNEDSNEQPTE